MCRNAPNWSYKECPGEELWRCYGGVLRSGGVPNSLFFFRCCLSCTSTQVVCRLSADSHVGVFWCLGCFQAGSFFFLPPLSGRLF